MSKAIRYDSLLVHALARELDHRMRGRRVRAIRIDPDSHTLTLTVGGRTLIWRLSPDDGGLALLDARRRLSGVRPARGTRVAAIRAPFDERILRVDLEKPGAGESVEPAGAVIVELITNQWNAIALGADERILIAVRSRSLGRTLEQGRPYEAPAGGARHDFTDPPDPDAWAALLAGHDPERRRAAMLATAAWTSPINVGWILGGDAQVDSAYERYSTLVRGPARPVVVTPGAEAQPYPAPIGPSAMPERSLLDAFARAAALREVPIEPAADSVAADALLRLHHRRERTSGRLRRLREELSGSTVEAGALRRRASLLLGQLHAVRRGADSVTLDDWEGGSVRIELDPAISPAANAERMFEAARRRERASTRLPPIIAKAETDLARLDAAIARVTSGESDPAEIRSLAGEARAATRQAPALPYRRYRTSGGLEIRVGRSGRANDDLTFHHSSPDDVWLHARDVAGAHVVLRWRDRSANPPSRDLTEAAVLAALHSRARTSGTVPVDWTRRKYVRKPRGAKPGLVVLERAKTIFVEPDEALERRLRSAEDGGG